MINETQNHPFHFIFFREQTPTIENMFNYLSYVSGAMAFITQIFLMSFHGQSITTESEKLPNRMFESNWIEMIDAKRCGDYGKILHIFKERLNHNVEIRVGKLWPLNLSTFQAVCIACCTHST